MLQSKWQYVLSAEKTPQESIISSEEPPGTIISISDRYLSALQHSLSNSWAYLGHTALQILGEGSCSHSFQSPKSGKRHHILNHIVNTILIFKCGENFFFSANYKPWPPVCVRHSLWRKSHWGKMIRNSQVCLWELIYSFGSSQSLHTIRS